MHHFGSRQLCAILAHRQSSVEMDDNAAAALLSQISDKQLLAEFCSRVRPEEMECWVFEALIGAFSAEALEEQLTKMNTMAHEMPREERHAMDTSHRVDQTLEMVDFEDGYDTEPEFNRKCNKPQRILFSFTCRSLFRWRHLWRHHWAKKLKPSVSCDNTCEPEETTHPKEIEYVEDKEHSPKTDGVCSFSNNERVKVSRDEPSTTAEDEHAPPASRDSVELEHEKWVEVVKRKKKDVSNDHPREQKVPANIPPPPPSKRMERPREFAARQSQMKNKKSLTIHYVKSFSGLFTFFPTFTYEGRNKWSCEFVVRCSCCKLETDMEKISGHTWANTMREHSRFTKLIRMTTLS